MSSICSLAPSAIKGGIKGFSFQIEVGCVCVSPIHYSDPGIGCKDKSESVSAGSWFQLFIVRASHPLKEQIDRYLY